MENKAVVIYLLESGDFFAGNKGTIIHKTESLFKAQLFSTQNTEKRKKVELTLKHIRIRYELMVLEIDFSSLEPIPAPTHVKWKSSPIGNDAEIEILKPIEDDEGDYKVEILGTHIGYVPSIYASDFFNEVGIAFYQYMEDI